MLEQEKNFDEDLAYGEYLRGCHTSLCEEEIDDLEQAFCKSKILKTNKHLAPINNLYIHPLKGA